MLRKATGKRRNPTWKEYSPKPRWHRGATIPADDDDEACSFRHLKHMDASLHKGSGFSIVSLGNIGRMCLSNLTNYAINHFQTEAFP